MNHSRLMGRVALIVSIGIASFSFSAAAPDQVAADGPENIGELLMERVAVLKSRHEHAVSGYNSGVFSFEQVHIARLEYLDARLEACTDRDERIAILKESVDTTRALHKTARERFEAFIGDKVEVLAAKACALDARIALAREQQTKPPLRKSNRRGLPDRRRFVL